MKIKYDSRLYREIASLELNELVQVKNRKGRLSTIYIRSIHDLSWNELQLLMPEGEDSFSKKVLLYRKFCSLGSLSESGKLSFVELSEINEYVAIYKQNSFSKHYEVNHYISDNFLWNRFSTIRSLNNHGESKGIPGIQPKYFSIICEMLDISGESGAALDSYSRY